MTHEETMQLIYSASRMSTMSYEEVVCCYLRARGILGGAYETLAEAIPEGWVPPRDRIPQEAIRSGAVTIKVRELAGELGKFSAHDIYQRMPDAAQKSIQNSLGYLERTGYIERYERGHYLTVRP
jgi:hypothetical protein